MEIFLHHIYEYKKGLRRMVLHTAPLVQRNLIEKKLKSQDISYLIIPVNSTKINVFFGDPHCVNIIRTFGDVNLSQLSDEQDFILGTLLGYDLVLQCKRYLKRKRYCEGLKIRKTANIAQSFYPGEYKYAS